MEEAFPYQGRVEFQDPESGMKVITSRAQSYREEYRERLESRRSAVKELCDRLNWSFLVHHTDRPASEAVLTLYNRLAGGRI